MDDNSATAAAIGGIALLERAVNYTLGSLVLVTPRSLSRPTPCADWDLRDLLEHLDDSLSALADAADLGHVALDVPVDDGRHRWVDPVANLRNGASRLLGAWTAGARAGTSVGGCPVTSGILTGAGAIEVAVHGWDVAQACGQGRPIPEALAEELLDLSPLFVSNADRPGRFAAPVAVSPAAGAADRLIAFLGRRSGPGW